MLVLLGLSLLMTARGGDEGRKNEEREVERKDEMVVERKSVHEAEHPKV